MYIPTWLVVALLAYLWWRSGKQNKPDEQVRTPRLSAFSKRVRENQGQIQAELDALSCEISKYQVPPMALEIYEGDIPKDVADGFGHVPMWFPSKEAAQAFGDKWSRGGADGFKVYNIEELPDLVQKTRKFPDFDKTSCAAILYPNERKFFGMLEPYTDRQTLLDFIKRMGIRVRELLRRKGSPYDELGLDDPKWTDDQLFDAMLANPILINRPIVVTPLGVKLCRPSETVLDILPAPQRGAFTKEDGERVVDDQGGPTQGPKPMRA